MQGLFRIWILLFFTGFRCCYCVLKFFLPGLMNKEVKMFVSGFSFSFYLSEVYVWNFSLSDVVFRLGMGFFLISRGFFNCVFLWQTY